MKNKLMRTILMAAVLAAPLALTACNTLEGAGKDIQAAGEEIEEAAES